MSAPLVWLMFIAVVFAMNIVWLGCSVWVARVLEQSVTSVVLGGGPRVFGFTRGETKWELRLLPFSAYVAFADGALESLPAWRRVLLMYGPWVLSGTLAFALGARLNDFIDGLTLIARLRDVFVRWSDWSELLFAAPILTLGRLLARAVAMNVLRIVVFTPSNPKSKWVAPGLLAYMALVVVGLVWPLLHSLPD